MGVKTIHLILISVILPAFLIAQQDSMTFKTYEIDTIVYVQNNPRMPKYEIGMSYLYPESFPDEDVLGTVRSYLAEYYGMDANDPLNSLKDRLYKKVERYRNSEKYYIEEIEQALESYGTTLDSFYKGRDPKNWGSLNNREFWQMEVVNQENYILTISHYRSEYHGGVHPNSSSRYFVFDLRSGQRIKPADIFIEGYEEPLTKIINNHIRTIYTDLEESFAVRPSSEILVKHEGLGFYYHDFICHAVGDHVFTISWEEIKHLLKNGNPLEEFCY